MTLTNLKFGFETTVKSGTTIFEGQLLKTNNIQEEITVEDMNTVIYGQTLNNSEISHIVVFLQIWTIPRCYLLAFVKKKTISEQASS